MLPPDRINPYRHSFSGSPFGRRFSGLLPWMFVIAVVLAIAWPHRHVANWPVPHPIDKGDADVILQRSAHGDARHAVDVIRTIDGDTFVARVHFGDGGDAVARVRLRGIDAPELKAACQEELTKAEAASDALHDLLGQGGVTIFDLGPDRYGRVVADVATRRTANVSAALLAGGYARSYNGGHREGWCARSWRFWQ
jgi:endonuclease YncB( thermonuclease family)